MLAKLTAWGLLAAIRLLTGAQARWWGCPPKAEQRIYFANHQSHIDLVMIWAALPEELRSMTRPIAARDYWANTPFKRWITTEVFHAIYVERGGSVAVPAAAAESGMPAATASATATASKAVAGATDRIEPSFDTGLARPEAGTGARTMVQAMTDAALRAAAEPASVPVAVPVPVPQAFEQVGRGAQFEIPLAELKAEPGSTHEAEMPAAAASQLAPASRSAPEPGSAEALAPLRPLIEALQSGYSIIIFPEGTRGHTGEPQKFKSGLYTLAQMFPEVVLVPAWIANVQRVMPKGEVVPVPILCSVTFGAPMQLQPGEERRPFLDRARSAVVGLRDV